MNLPVYKKRLAQYHLCNSNPQNDFLSMPVSRICPSQVFQHRVVQRETLTADISKNYLTNVWNPQQAFKVGN